MMYKKEENKRFQVFCSFLVVFMMAGMFHLHHWNQYFFEIFPLKSAQILGVASKDQLNRVADICKERNKHGCVIQAYKGILAKNSKDYVTIEALAETQHLLNKNRDAAHTLNQYFLGGGDSLRATYIYARVLQALEQHQEAAEQYKKAIEKKPNTLQVNVSEDYVSFLMSQREYKKAKRFIEKLRRKGVPKYFLSSEYSEINMILKRSS